MIFEGSDDDDDFRNYSQASPRSDDEESDDVELPRSDISIFSLGKTMQIPLYHQVGSGFEPRPGPSSRGPAFIENDSSENLDNVVIINEINRRRNQRYNAEEVTFQARIDPEQIPPRLQATPLVAAVEAVRSLISILILRCTQNLSPFDLIRFCFMAVGLDRPVSTVLMRVSELTVERVVAPIIHVLQSYKNLKLKDGVTVDVIITHREVGEGRNRRVINIESDRLKKKSVLMIPYDEEGLCCSKAILYALAHLENDRPSINAMRDIRRPYLLKKAKDLHRDAENLNRVSYRGKDRDRRINLWLLKGHYDVIKSLKGFYGSQFYCEPCDKPFDHLENHRCGHVCPVRMRRDCLPGQSQRCLDCDRLCRSASCFESHKAIPGRRQKSLCDKMYKCRECCKVILRENCPKHLHNCGTTKCPSCKYFVDASEHRCFLDVVSAKTPSDHIFFFDFETDQSSGTHRVNFAVAQYADGGETVFTGNTACQDFCSWLFAPIHKGYTAVAHNMKGFDGQFIMAWLLEQGIAPPVIPCVSKVMSINHPTLNIKLIDSFNFLPMSLSKLPGCFGMTELKKGYFPHLFNKEENQTYVGPFPDMHYYSPDTMSGATRTDFLSWYNSQEGQQFDFQHEMLTYCSYVTIASACMAAYRSKHLEKETTAMVPVRGYTNCTNFSPDAIRWLDFIATKESIFIEHALNRKGERKIDDITVDGFCEETKTSTNFT
ncbi:hypothetical protein AVEN_38544-1 [Araneus ventricosus]|uniref:DNA-directed DNA polymerase n=1 Tax=Araneus ventricosus TaxID=182803 RepID=A0A4Y2MIN7_ARAVE|nr:hypothetical protein AVEN_38544-1 [Araneus ventricosus]